MAVNLPSEAGGHKYIWARIEGEDHVVWQPTEGLGGSGYLDLMKELSSLPKNGHLERDHIRDAGSAYVDLLNKRIEYGGGHPAYSKGPEAFRELIEACSDFEFIIP